MPVSRIEQYGRNEERQEYRIRCSDAAGPGRQDHGRDEQAKKFDQVPSYDRGWRFKVLGVFPNQRLFGSNLPVTRRHVRVEHAGRAALGTVPAQGSLQLLPCGPEHGSMLVASVPVLAHESPFFRGRGEQVTIAESIPTAIFGFRDRHARVRCPSASHGQRE
jgi:hypothetical protein